MYSKDMDLIKEDNETIPNKLLDSMFEIVKSSYIELGQELVHPNKSLSNDLNNLIIELLSEDRGYTCLLWVGIILGQCALPTIKVYNPNTDLMDVVLGLVCGHCFTYGAVNEPYAKDKILLPCISEDIRERLFVDEYSHNNITLLSNTQYKNTMLVYYHLLGLCINPNVINDMVNILTLCIEKDVITNDLNTKKLLLDWVVLEVIPSAWERRIPINMYDIENLNQ